jgi:plastocyanin
MTAALVVAAASCGGSDSSPSGGGGGGGGGTPPNPATTFTITSSGVSPKTLTVARGTQVTFTNNDTRPHDMSSDPHPDHTDCREINDVGFLSPGQSRQTGNLNTPRVCGFHDHNDAFNTALQGTITIQ